MRTWRSARAGFQTSISAASKAATAQTPEWPRRAPHPNVRALRVKPALRKVREGYAGPQGPVVLAVAFPRPEGRGFLRRAAARDRLRAGAEARFFVALYGATEVKIIHLTKGMPNDFIVA